MSKRSQRQVDAQRFTLRRNALLFGIVGLAAAGLGAAFLVRAQDGVDVGLGAFFVLVGVVGLFALVGARHPLLTADDDGIRVRYGAGWQELPWTAVRQVVVEENDAVLRDGRLVVLPRDPAVLADRGLLGRVHAVWSRRWYGAPLSVPLAMTTRASSDDVAGHISELANGRTDVMSLRGRHASSLAEVPARIGSLVSRVGRGQAHDVDAPGAATAADADAGPATVDGSADTSAADEAIPVIPARAETLRFEDVEISLDEALAEGAPAAAREDTGESADDEARGGRQERPEADGDAADAGEASGEPARPEPVSPLRSVVAPQRREVTRSVPAAPGHLEDETGEGTGDGSPVAPGDGPNVRVGAPDPDAPLTPLADAGSPLRFDDVAEEAEAVPPPAEPVIGPVLRAARERIRLSIDELSERTRIRPHVIAAIEVDDFEPCGGDVYARGHLGTLSRALGVELDPLLRQYDERYARGPVNPRRVFEAELASGLGGGMRATVSGPTWSLLVAAVLCLLLVWGVARLFSDPAEEVALPGSSESAGLAANREPITSPKMKLTTMTVTARFADSKVVVKDRTGKVLWSGDLAQGDKRKVAGRAPFEVEADNAGAVEVMVLGEPQGTVGTAGAPGKKTFD